MVLLTSNSCHVSCCRRAIHSQRRSYRSTTVAPLGQPLAGSATQANSAVPTSKADVFRTIVDVNPINPRLNYDSSCLLIGSCFVDNIGARLESAKFKSCANPFGTIFNPVSIARLLLHTADPTFRYSPTCLSSDGSFYFSYDHHSSLSSEDAGTCLDSLNSRLVTARASLTSSKFLIVTLGTSWVYRYQQTDSIVANCHKKASRLFSKELLTTAAVVSSMQSAISACLKVNPGLQVILTVSPVRHWKDGPIENQASKATLVLATHELCRWLPASIQYFPAYEIQLDDLRDYRFYDQDMLHPSRPAVDYIWGRLVHAWMDPVTVAVMQQVDKVVAATMHRPLHPGSMAHRSFLEQTATKLEELSEQLPHADFEPEWCRLEAAVPDVPRAAATASRGQAAAPSAPHML